MKLNFRRLMAMFLSIVMVAGMLPAAVFAEDGVETQSETYVAAVDGTGYKSFADALAKADGKTIKLLTDVRVASATVEADKNITIDLNGCTITGADNVTDGDLAIMGTASLRITDSSNLSTGKFDGVVLNRGALTIESGTVTSDSCSSDGIGGTIGGTIICQPDDQGNLPKLYITGGTVSYTGEAVPGMAISASNTNGRVSELNISGGTITSTGFCVIAEATGTISGGTFTGKDLDDYGITNVILTGGATITGGTYNTNVSDYVAKGYKLDENGNVVQSAPAVTYVATVNGVGYESLDAAFAAAQAGDTIVIGGDITSNSPVVIDVNKNLTITGNGMQRTTGATLTGIGINAVEGCGELTVSNLTFAGNSWINSGAASKLTVSGVTANVTPNNSGYTNSRSAFISLGNSEQKPLELVVENSSIVANGGADPILGWAAITKATITGNTFGSADAYQTNSDSVKFMAIADDATLNFKGNTVYSNFNGIVLGQNTTRDNAYTATFTNNTFFGSADHVWIEVSGSNTCNGNVNVKSDNTINGNIFTVEDIKVKKSLQIYTGYMGVDVELDAEGKVIGGTMKFASDGTLADGYELGADGKVVQSAPVAPAVVEVKTYEELIAALAGDVKSIKMMNDITATATQSSGYGKAGIVINAGYVLDGNGKTLTINGANSTWDSAITMRGGEVKNLTIAGAMRGVFMPGANGDVVIDNCVFKDVIYTFNSDAGSKDYTVTIKNTTLNGWTSFSNVHKSVTFEDCSFGKGSGYQFCRPYQATTFTNCSFDEGFTLDTTATEANNLAFNGCTYNDTALSAKNNAMFYNGGKVLINGVSNDVTNYPPTGLSGTGTAEDPYLINDLEELKWFRDKVDNVQSDRSNQFLGKYVKLTADIDLAGINWNPIGEKKDHGSFMGIFDGGDYTISNLYVEQAGEYLGLFAYTGSFSESEQAVIKNLTLHNVTVKSTNNSNYVGGLVGNATTTNFENIYVTGTVEISGGAYIGGIVGHGYSDFDNVSVKATNGTISSTIWCAGGVIGYLGEGSTIKNAVVEDLTIKSAAGGLGSIVGMSSSKDGTQPCTGENLSAKNVAIQTYTGAYGDVYAENGLGYLIGGDTPVMTGSNTVENVTFACSNGTTNPDVSDAVASVNGTIYFDLQSAIDAAQNGDEVAIHTAGTYSLAGISGKNITVTGTVDGVVFDNIGSFGMNGANVTFTNVTFDYYPNVNYTGLQHSGNLVYNNCTFNGQVFLYGVSETFNTCKFNQNSADAYNVWTYGAKEVTFNNCIFNSAGKSVLVYNESATAFTNLAVANTTFNASAAVDGKAAIEIDTSLSAGANITVDAATTATGFGTGSVSGDSLWNNKKGSEGDNNDITIVVGSTTVLSPAPAVTYVAYIGTQGYESLQEAITAAQSGDVVVIKPGTYAVPSMKAGLTLVGDGNVIFEGTLTSTLENLTLKNIYIKGDNAQRWAYAKGNLYFENVTFEATSVYALHFDGITAGATLTYKNCTIIGWAAMSGSPKSVVFDECTFKGNGTYGLIRTYFDATITNCTFDVANVNTTDSYQDGIHAVAATVTVNNSTNVNGDMKDIIHVSGDKDSVKTAYVVLDGEVAAIALSGDGSAEKPYLINNRDDLIWFQGKVDEQAADGSTQFAGKYFKLTADIDLAGINWNPIGSMSGDHGSFKGVFDGDGHTISNLNVQQAGNGLGLFARTAGNAEIKNLTLNNVTVKSTDNSDYVGGLVGNSYASTKITNVHVTGNIDISGKGYIGGISGHGYVVMDNVSVIGTGTISSTFWCAGGILGYAGEGATNIMNAHVEGITITSAAGGLGAIVGMAEDNNGTQPISGSNLSAKNVAIKTYTGAYGDAYANYALGYLYGGNPTSKLTGTLTVENVTVETSNRETPTIVDAVASVNGTIYFDLQSALDAAAAGTGNVTVEILRDVNLTGIDWNPVTVSAAGYPIVTVNGNNKTITGLNDMLFAGTWAGGSGLIINDLTIADSKIVNDKDDTKGTVGVGAFIGFPQASATITLSNCHLVNSIVEGGHWTGGLIGMAGGYNGNDGPVFMNLTITGCSVTGSTITGKGSAGGVIGHGSCAAWTNVVIENTTVSGNTITSTGSSTNKAGSVMGTIGAAGQPTTVNGVTLTGGAFVSATVSGNTVTSAGTTITTIYGRQGTVGGTLEVTGGSYDKYPIEENVSYAAPAEGYVIEKSADGTYGLVIAPTSKTYNVSTKADLDAAIAAAAAGDTILLTADIDYGTDQLKLEKAITLDLGGKTLTTRNAWGGMSVKNNPTIKNGTIVHASNTAAIKVWNATAFEDLVIDVQGKGDANKTIGGIVLQEGSTTHVGSIKNVTIKGVALTNGIETYNCGNATEPVIGSMENVTIDAKSVGLYISAPCGTATNCSIKGGINGIEIWIKGTYSATLNLVNCNVVGGVFAHDEFNSNPSIVNNGTLKLTADTATTGASEDAITLTIARAEKVEGILKKVMDNAQAKVNDTYYATLASAIAAAQNGDIITLIWAEGDAPIAMNGAVYDKIVTITGTATVDWSKGNLFVGRGGEGNGTVIFDNAKLTSASNSSSYGIHVSGREKNTTDKYDGTLVIKNSTIELDYLINKGTMTLDNSNLTVKNGFSIGGRPAKETVSGEDATATISLTNGSKVIVNNHNGMGLGYEAIGVMNIDKTSSFETTQSFLVTAKGTMNLAGTATVAGTLTNNGSIVLTDAAATLTSSECGKVTTTVNGYEVEYAGGKYAVVEEVGTIKATEATLLYNEIIQMRFIFALTGDAESNGILVFKDKSDADNHEISKAAQNRSLEFKSGKYYGYTDGIPAKEMGDTVYIVGYLKFADGTYAFSQTVPYSPLIYAERMMTKGTEETKALCKALMHYGAAAQTFMNYNTSNLMNANFEEVPFDISVLGNEQFSYQSGNVNGFTIKEANMLFEGAISYRFKYQIDSSLEGKALYMEYVVKGVTKTVELKAIGDFYYGYAADNAAKDMDELIIAKPFYYNENNEKVYGGSITYSGYEYARRMTNSSTATAAGKALAQAFAMYINAANTAIK